MFVKSCVVSLHTCSILLTCMWIIGYIRRSWLSNSVSCTFTCTTSSISHQRYFLCPSCVLMSHYRILCLWMNIAVVKIRQKVSLRSPLYQTKHPVLALHSAPCSLLILLLLLLRPLRPHPTLFKVFRISSTHPSLFLSVPLRITSSVTVTTTEIQISSPPPIPMVSQSSSTSFILSNSSGIIPSSSYPLQYPSQASFAPVTTTTYLPIITRSPPPSMVSAVVSSKNQQQSTTALVAGIVGGVLGLCLLISVVTAWCRWRQLRRKAEIVDKSDDLEVKSNVQEDFDLDVEGMPLAGTPPFADQEHKVWASHHVAK